MAAGVGLPASPHGRRNPNYRETRLAEFLRFDQNIGRMRR
ncbi:hypothetical protein PATSB16_41900 [Pandoraea thiooxydans]|nr:hypothetical protein PATSB16_41900 [Pandoraea thiooxydans]